MQLFSLIDINIIAIICLVFILLTKGRYLKNGKQELVIYKKLLEFTLLMIILQVLGLIIPLSTEGKYIPLHKVINVVGFALVPYIGKLFVEYVYMYLNEKRQEHFKNLLVLLNLLLCIGSYQWPLVFSVDKYNQYHRENLFFVPIIISFIYLAKVIIIIIKYRHKIDTLQALTMGGFVLITIIGILFQIIIPEIAGVWSYVGIYLTIYCIYLQDRTLKYDALTGAWSRMAIENYIRMQLLNERCFTVLWIDLDYFKEINDTYGHQEGDFALKETVCLFKKGMRKKEIIARMGGDEFLILLKEDQKEEIEAFITSSKENFKTYNEKNEKPYKILWSEGYTICDKGCRTLDEILNCADEKMYQKKRLRKNECEFF